MTTKDSFSNTSFYDAFCLFLQIMPPLILKELMSFTAVKGYYEDDDPDPRAKDCFVLTLLLQLNGVYLEEHFSFHIQRLDDGKKEIAAIGVRESERKDTDLAVQDPKMHALLHTLFKVFLERLSLEDLDQEIVVATLHTSRLGVDKPLYQMSLFNKNSVKECATQMSHYKKK
jgi:hypothetical protein